MIYLVLVHGTGVRTTDYNDTLAVVREQLIGRADVRVVECNWGESQGCRLHAGGASVPTYDSTRNLGGALDPSEEEQALWGLLLRDPQAELRLLSLRANTSERLPLGAMPAEALIIQLEKLSISWDTEGLLRETLTSGGLRDVFGEAIGTILDSDALRDAIASASEPFAGERAAVARALVAQAAALRRDQGYDPAIRLDAARRDRLVSLLIDSLGGVPRGMGAQLGKHAWQLAAAITNSVVTTVGTYYAQFRRGRLTDAAVFKVGDILLYQAKGEEIRRTIARSVSHAQAEVNVHLERREFSKLAIVAHSLGGIAAIDLLAEDRRKPDGRRELDGVSLLVTLGSQAPFLYEIGALTSLPYGMKLPANFPAWLNFYDLSDFLSYVGGDEKLFGAQIEDRRVSSGQPFPSSHSAYFRNPLVWQEILERIK